MPTSTPHQQFIVSFAHQGQQGAQMVRQACADGRPFAMAFVDMRMPPGWDGVQTIENLWTIDPDLQIVICSAHSDYSHSDIQQRLGQSDRMLILRKPFDTSEVGQLACALTKKWELLQESKAKREILEQLVSQRTAELQNANQHLTQANDALRASLSEQRRLENQLRHDALHDSLTGLANRTLLTERLGQCIERKKRQGDYQYAALFLDLDNFKTINDCLGHAQGDKLLVRVAQRIERSLRYLDMASRPANDTIGRAGGDEFVIVLDGLKQPSDALRVALRVLDELAQEVDHFNEHYSVSCSIGVAMGEPVYEQPDEILRDADIALYEAKSAGKNRCTVFDQEMRDKVLARLRVNNDLRWAVTRDELSLQYQPIVSLESGDIVAFEALLRWNQTDHGPISPQDFIPIAEETGLIDGIGEWVLNQACQQLATWHKQRPALRMNINVSPRQLLDQTFVARFLSIARQSGVDPHNLSLEITETAMMKNHSLIKQAVAMLRQAGTQIHMDDFGVGYSSLSYLDILSFDALKIDRSFVMKLGAERAATASLQSIIQLADARGLNVVAEGVETQDAVLQLQSLDCKFAQGYFFSRPQDVANATTLLTNTPSWINPAAPV